MSRNQTIDILKGICIALVVLGHYGGTADNVSSSFAEGYDAFVHIIYTFHMPAFMWASGFLYILSLRATESYKSFQIKKARRLLLPYLVVSVIVVSIKLLTQTLLYVENPVTLETYLRILILPEAAYYLWYIWALLIIFLIVPFFKTPKSRLLFLGASIILAILPVDFPEYFCIKQAILFMPFFALGMTSCDFAPRVHRLGESLPITNYFVVSIILFVTLVMIYLYGNTADNKINFYILGIVGIAATLCLSFAYAQSNLPKTSVIILANASFVIYLFHTTFQGFGKAIFHRISVPTTNIGTALDIISVNILSIAATIALYYIFRSWRPTANLFGLRYTPLRNTSIV